MSSCQTFDEIFSFENAEHHICKVMMSGVEGRGRSRFAVELRDPISPMRFIADAFGRGKRS